MGGVGSFIETGVDKLVKLIKERSKISMDDAAKELGVSLTVVEEWADFIEEEGIIRIEYKFTKPFLVDKKLTRTEVSQKGKEFKGKKEVFVRKAEGTLNFLEKEAERLKSVKGEFDKLKKEFGFEIGSMKSEIKELERYQQLKASMDQETQKRKAESDEKIKLMDQNILKEQKKYLSILDEVKKEAEKLKKEKQAALSIEEKEKVLKERLSSLKEMSEKIEKKAGEEDLTVKNSEEHVERLKNLADSMNRELENEKNEVEKLVNKSQEYGRRVKETQDNILKKMAEKEKKFDVAKKVSKKFERFFDKKMKVIELIDEINKSRDILEKDLIGLVKKAKSFQLSSESVDIGKEMLELENKFKEVDKKKGLFEKEFKKLNIIFKK